MDVSRAKIFKALPSDIDGIFFVSKNTWLNTYKSKEYNIARRDILSKDFDSEARHLSWLKTIKTNGKKDKYVIVAKSEGEVIGFGVASKDLAVNEISAVYILKKYQGQGIGKKIMKKCLKWLGEDKQVHVKVVVYNQKAINFYKKFNFKVQRKIEYKVLPSGKELPLFKMIRCF